MLIRRGGSGAGAGELADVDDVDGLVAELGEEGARGVVARMDEGG